MFSMQVSYVKFSGQEAAQVASIERCMLRLVTPSTVRCLVAMITYSLGVDAGSGRRARSWSEGVLGGCYEIRFFRGLFFPFN